MTDYSELNQKRIAFCYMYGNNGELFMHCSGEGRFDNGILSITRMDEDDFVVSNNWEVQIKKIPSDKKEAFRNSDYLIAMRIIPLESLNKKSMALILCDADKASYLVTGICVLTNEVLHFEDKQKSIHFIIYRDWYPLIKQCSDHQKKSLGNSDFMLTLDLGPLGPDVAENEYIKTGLNISTMEKL